MIQGLFKSRIMTIHSIYWSFSYYSCDSLLIDIFIQLLMGEKVSGNRYIHIKLCSPGKIQTGILKKKNIEIPTSWSTLLQQRAISSYCNRVLCHCHDGSETLLRGREWKDCTTFNNNRHFFAFQVQTLSYLVTTERN